MPVVPAADHRSRPVSYAIIVLCELILFCLFLDEGWSSIRGICAYRSLGYSSRNVIVKCYIWNGNLPLGFTRCNGTRECIKEKNGKFWKGSTIGKENPKSNTKQS